MWGECIESTASYNCVEPAPTTMYWSYVTTHQPYAPTLSSPVILRFILHLPFLDSIDHPTEPPICPRYCWILTISRVCEVPPRFQKGYLDPVAA
ncbi:hypothetical protein YC2023_031953 [Brassica napus]